MVHVLLLSRGEGKSINVRVIALAVEVADLF